MTGREIPIGPFREWVEARLRIRDAYGETITADVLAARCGVSESKVHRWRYDMTSISVVEVDDALTQEGSTALWELGVYKYDNHGHQVEAPPSEEMDSYRRAAEGGEEERVGSVTPLRRRGHESTERFEAAA